MYRIMVAALAAGLLAGCGVGGNEHGEGKPVGSFLDPVCAPDGSNVYTLYPNEDGEYEPNDVSRDYCPWNRGSAS